MMASGLSAHLVGARDLPFQPLVGNMGTNQSGYFLLSRGIIGRVPVGIHRVPGNRGGQLPLSLIWRKGQSLVGWRRL
jgi:hypothetical protein